MLGATQVAILTNQTKIRITRKHANMHEEWKWPKHHIALAREFEGKPYHNPYQA